MEILAIIVQRSPTVRLMVMASPVLEVIYRQLHQGEAIKMEVLLQVRLYVVQKTKQEDIAKE